MPAHSADLVIVGAGAAGLATAIFAARARPGARIVALDGADRLGAKILVAGGGRCNVTHQIVSAHDYCGGSRNTIRRVLEAFPVSATIAFFREIGVPLHLEETGKYFPDSNRARTVLDALLVEAARRKVEIRTGRRVSAIESTTEPTSGAAGRFRIDTAVDAWTATRVVLAAGGRSLPKSGSDGFGYVLARRLGHSLVEQTPALAPLLLDGDFHTSLSGVSHPAELSLYVDNRRTISIRGPMLWTHFGISGPAAMDFSRHWLRDSLEGRSPTARLALVLDVDFPALERRILDAANAAPRSTVLQVLRQWVPERVAAAVLASLRIDAGTPLAQLAREARRSIVHQLLEFPLPIAGCRGYNYAEATAGGVPLREIDPRTMQSRLCPGLSLVGEILDVDGRIGGFNFQWAWATGYVCGGAFGTKDEA